jgi:hypothetical protein
MDFQICSSIVNLVLVGDRCDNCNEVFDTEKDPSQQNSRASFGSESRTNERGNWENRTNRSQSFNFSSPMNDEENPFAMTEKNSASEKK